MKKPTQLKVWSYSLSYRIDGEGGLLVTKANKFLETAEVHGLSPDTARAYAFALLALFRWLKCDWNLFERFTQKTLQDWMVDLKAQGLQPRTINHRLCSARTFFRFCFGKNIPHAAGVIYPRAHYKGPRRARMGLVRRTSPEFLELRIKPSKKVIDPLIPEDIDAFLKHVRRYRDLGITLTMLLCGLRSQEVIALRLEDIDFNQNQLRVHGKGNRERLVPMPFRLMQLFEKYLDYERPSDSENFFFVILQGQRAGEKMTRSGIRRLFRYRKDLLGIKKIRPHQFRHAFASDMARAGVPVTTIQKLLGHSDIKTTLIYIELFLDDIRAEYDKAIKRIEERYATLQKPSAS